MTPLLLSALAFVVLYFVVRMAVAHGIGDAHDFRTSREQADKLLADE